MKNWAEEQDLRLETRKIATSNTLKRCVLCGAVNALENPDCFVCGWHGRFDSDPIQIEKGVNLLLDRCPELAEAMIEKAAELQRHRSIFQKIATFFVRHKFAWHKVR